MSPASSRLLKLSGAPQVECSVRALPLDSESYCFVTWKEVEGGSGWPFPIVLLTPVHVRLNAELGDGAVCPQTQGWAGEGTEPTVGQAENGSCVTPGITEIPRSEG